MDNRTFGYLGLGALTGIAVGALLSKRGRMVFGCGDKGVSEYRKQSGEGSETSEREFEQHDAELFRAEVADAR